MWPLVRGWQSRPQRVSTHKCLFRNLAGVLGHLLFLTDKEEGPPRPAPSCPDSHPPSPEPQPGQSARFQLWNVGYQKAIPPPTLLCCHCPQGPPGHLGGRCPGRCPILGPGALELVPVVVPNPRGGPRGPKSIQCLQTVHTSCRHAGTFPLLGRMLAVGMWASVRLRGLSCFNLAWNSCPPP